MERATEAATALAEPEPRRSDLPALATGGYAAQVLMLQRTAGNRATARLLQRQPPDGGAPDGGLPDAGSGCLATAPEAPQPAATATPDGSGWLASPVADAPHPVTFTDLTDARRVRDIARDQAFGGLDEVSRFAGALRDEMLRRGRTRLTASVLADLRARARTAAEGQRIEGESSRARRDRIQAAATGVAAPTDAEVDAAILERLRESFAEHLGSRQAQDMTVAELANAWMRNRQEGLLFDTETQTRPRGQARMWSNFWIEPEAEDEEPVESPRRAWRSTRPPAGPPATAAPASTRARSRSSTSSTGASRTSRSAPTWGTARAASSAAGCPSTSPSGAA
jgi:hypothetical protein